MDLGKLNNFYSSLKSSGASFDNFSSLCLRKFLTLGQIFPFSVNLTSSRGWFIGNKFQIILTLMEYSSHIWEKGEGAKFNSKFPEILKSNLFESLRDYLLLQTKSLICKYEMQIYKFQYNTLSKLLKTFEHFRSN